MRTSTLLVLTLLGTIALTTTLEASDALAQPQTPRPTQVQPASPAPVPAPPAQAIDINTASAEELQQIPGIGPTRADAVVTYRQRVGRFQRAEDLLRVKGIGRTTFRRIRAWIRVGAGAPVANRPARR